MKNTFGSSVSVTVFGESHGPSVGVVLDGLAPGIEVDEAFIAHQLSLRRPADALSTGRREPDPFVIESGVYRGKTTGTPICIRIPNTAQHSEDYANYGKARPGHADYTAYAKYHGNEDPRGGGHFSGRITAGLVAAGAIALSALKKKNIFIGTHLSRCAQIDDRGFEDYRKDIEILSQKAFPVLSSESETAMKQAILTAKEEGDSVGGILETAVVGLLAGVGEPWFDTVESMLSHMMFAIPAVKGIEFGAGFDIADMRGSTANDSMGMENSRVITKTNHNGGINGGITNGMPIVFRTAVKPTPTIFKPQNTIDFKTMTEKVLEPKGRHDPAIVHRARVVQDAATAIVLCDALAMRFGTDYLK
jgi:chorismate synthase